MDKEDVMHIYNGILAIKKSVLNFNANLVSRANLIYSFILEKERHLNAKLGSRIDSTETGTPVWAV